MSDVIAVLLADATRATDAVHALEARHAAGSLTIFGLALLGREADGTLRLRRPATPGPSGAPLAGLVRRLVARAGGTAEDGLADLGIAPDFVEEVLGALAPGHVALLAEVEEHWFVAGDAALAAFEGSVIRRRRLHRGEDWIASEVSVLDAELQALERAAEDAAGDLATAIRRRATADRVRLAALAARTDVSLAALHDEVRARLALLDRQFRQADMAGDVRGETQVRIALSIARMRAEAERRSVRLRRAVEVAQQALGTEDPEDG
ncbi:hypothetical protein E2C06_22025 [Dankookia rubra]|uniref:Uncharacterized protein n=1 Tax=Dankookia rubra TaxID=1442381 RepID=A0A4R5QCU3_9PROT|nr:DUF1269 domain-containing protein [Dankookia rubra]TDH60419.1 hypothetical protein E2C06_22025 [Dankookia rubra]